MAPLSNIGNDATFLTMEFKAVFFFVSAFCLAAAAANAQQAKLQQANDVTTSYGAAEPHKQAKVRSETGDRARKNEAKSSARGAKREQRPVLPVLEVDPD